MSVSTLYYRMAKGIAPYIGLDEDETQGFLNDAPGISILMVLLACRVYQHTDGKLPKSCWHIPDFEWPVGLTDGEAYGVDRLLHSVFPTFVKAVKGERLATDKVKAIRRIINNTLFDLGAYDIKDLAAKKYNQSRARAWDIFRLMGHIAYAVTPKKQNEKSILVGKVESLKLEYLKVGVSLVNRAREICDSNSKATLQSLAIRMYYEELEKWGYPFEIDSLERDMRDAKKWVKKNPDKLTKYPVLIHTFDNKGNLVNTEQLPVGGGSFLYGREDW